MFAHPKLPQDKQVSSIVELVDVYPTIIDICDISTQTPLSGKSLVGLMEGDTNSRSYYAFNQFGRPYSAAINGKRLSRMGYSVRSDQFRLTLWFNHESGEIDGLELYDMNEG